jgi:3-phosphoshikimate 1-carboxyvinyltransferase
MAEFRVKRCRPIFSELSVPGDKSISHRAVIIGALSNGPCLIEGFLPGEDSMATVEAMRSLGVRIDLVGKAGETGSTSIRVHGTKGKFKKPDGPIDCGNSGTTMRLLAGLLSAQPFQSTLIGDESLTKRPMNRIVEPLRAMGANIEAEGKDGRPPIQIRPSRRRKAFQYLMPVASAQLKSALLLAGLFVDGKTTVTEPVPTRDHTEKILEYFLVKTASDDGDVSIWGRQIPESRDFKVPGDISSAAFWIVAAAAQRDSLLTVKNVGLNKTRSGILQVLIRMGAHIGEYIDEPVRGEPYGSLEIKGEGLTGTTIGGEEIPNLIDELPILAVAGALAEGTTVIKDAAELRVKETDRIAAVVKNLKKMGADVNEFQDGMEIHGGAVLKGATLSSYGDHRIAMAFAVAGLFADGETVIEDVECVDTSYPGFLEDLKRMMSNKVLREPLTPVISSVASSATIGKSRTVGLDPAEKKELDED